MTVASFMDDIILLMIFLVIGFSIREIVKPLQKLYIPSSIIGGLITLILGQQVLGIIEIPETFNQLSGTFITIVMTALVFGISINKKRINAYLDFTLLMLITYGIQLLFGTVIGEALGKIWTNLPPAWGTLGVFAFFGGHGNSAVAGALYQELGVQDNLSMGMILATIGLISAIAVGMIIVNWGIRKGYANYLVDDEGQEILLGGVLSEDKQISIGNEKASSSAINSLALQFALLCVAIFIGDKIIDLLSMINEMFNKIPNMARGMIGAAILYNLMKAFKVDGYADKKTCSTISGFCLELIITSAIATLRLDFFSTYIVPIAIFSMANIILTLIISLFIGKKLCRIDWFEKVLLNFGQSTGNASTGLALVRSVDPDFKSTAAESTGVGSAVLVPLTGTLPAIVPIIAMQSITYVAGIGAAITLVAIILIVLFIRNNYR